MKFSSDLLIKTWAIKKAKVIVNGLEVLSLSWKEAIKEAIRQAIKVRESFLRGLVTFFKLPKNENDDAVITTRRIATLESFGLKSENKGTIKAIDLDKYEATGNIHSSVISFHGYQVL